MNVVIRVDSSDRIGSGHLMRCITLAGELSRNGASILFICRAYHRNLSGLARERGYRVVELSSEESAARELGEAVPEHASWLGVDWLTDARETMQIIEETVETADWLVVDHYGIDRRWESTVRARVRRVLVIDDLADRQHDCDLLVDQTYGRSAGEYELLTPAHCRKLVGSDYALLRPEFRQVRERSPGGLRNAQLRRILVNVGGMDPDNVTEWILQAIAATDLPGSTMIDVVLGSSAPHVRAVAHAIETMPFEAELSIGVTDMAERMAATDLAIGASGTTAWERCCLGLPSIVITFADNQHAIARALEAAGAVLCLGDFHEIQSDSTSVTDAINGLASEPETLACMSAAASSVTDGLGAERVAAALVKGVGDDRA